MDNPLNEYIYRAGMALGALLIGTWAWFVRHVFFKKLNDMEKRISELEQNTLSKTDIRAMEADLRAATHEISKKIGDSQRGIYEKIERTEDKIDIAHDRILDQMRDMISLVTAKLGN